MDLRDEQYTLIDPVLTLGLNLAGTFTFTMPPNHPNHDCIVKLSSKIKVYRILKDSTQKWLFTGRSLTDEQDFYNTGKIECEGILAYLIDSIVRPYDYSGSPTDYFTQLIDSHNSQVESVKKFTIGSVDIVDKDNNNYIVRANANYPTTYSELAEKVVNNLNCYLYATESDGKQYINCTMQPNSSNTQVIQFGENLIDLVRKTTADSLKTVIIPLGAQGEDGSYLTIKSVNNDLDYVEDADAVALYGRIVGTVNFDDVTLPENLIKKGRAYLKEVLAPFSTITVNAVDMSMTSADIDTLELGYVQVISKPHNLNKQVLLSQMELHLLDPASNKYTLGVTETTMSANVAGIETDIAERIQRVKKETSTMVDSKIDNATQIITGAKGGYVLIDEDGEGHPWRILIMDSADKNAAQNVIQFNKNGIGFSTNGINGTYANAWTIDGNLVADFITAGTMYADRIKGGTLTLGGVDNKSGVANIIDGSGKTLVKLDKNGITLDSSVKIAWGNISGTDDVAYKDDIPTDDHITQITKNTVTTAYVNALNITAGSVAAENITGSTISGKTISGGTVTGATITGNTISGGTIDGSVINGGTINGGTVNGGIVTGASITGSNITGSSFYQNANNTYLSIANGEIRGGKNGSETGYISYASNVDGTPSLDFRATILNFCMDTIYLGRGKGATEMTKAYTGDIRYVWQVGATSYETAVMSFTNGILLDNGRTS